MLKTGNRRTVRRLALRQVKNSRKINVVVILSIVLTCILFTALFSIGGGIMKSFQTETMRQVGGSAMAGVKCILPEDYERIAADKAVKNPAYRIVVGNVANESLKNISAEVNYAQDEDARMLFSYPTEGRMPKEREEIAMSTLTLDELGIPHKLGERVHLRIDIDGRIVEEDFTLCGFWPGDKAAMAQESFVSRQFCDEVAPTPARSFYEDGSCRYGGYWMMDFDFSNSWDIEAKLEKLMERCGYVGENEINYGVNWAYVADSVDPEMLVTAGVLLALILLAGYLMIYNVFYINVTANIRNYGLLKTIGMTGKQLKRMVRCQAFIYSAAGLLPGLLIGTLISRLLLPVIMEGMFGVETAELSLNALIYAAATAFTFITVSLSCLKPCRFAASVAPVEALRHSGVSVRRKRKRSTRVTPFSMARANLSRMKKKTAVVVLSLSLSIVLLNLVYMAVRGFDADKYLSNLIVGDFVIGDSSMIKGSSLERDITGVKEDDIAYFGSLDGVTSVAGIYCSESDIVLDETHYDRVDGFLDKYAELTEEDGEDWAVMSFREERKLLSDIYGVNRPAFDLIAEDTEGMDAEEFFEGGRAVIYTYSARYHASGADGGKDRFYEPGETVQVELPDGTVREYEVMAVREMPYPISLKGYNLLGAQVVIPDSDLLPHREEQGAMYTVLSAEEGKLDEIGAELESYVTQVKDHLACVSKQTYLDEFSGLKNMFWLLGGALSLILALIGILNFINAVVTGVFARQREFAAMQAVGMTGRQLTAMLIWEGIFYAVFTAVFSVLAGSLIGEYVVKAVVGEIFFFTYHFTLTPVLACIPVLLLFSAAVPFAACRVICRESIVDRLREAES